MRFRRSRLPSLELQRLLNCRNRRKRIFRDLQDYWEELINKFIEQANVVQEEKADEKDKHEQVEEVKTLVPGFITEANRLFVSIPDSQRYKIAYVVSLIEQACEEYDVDVFKAFDWKGYVTELYTVKELGA